MKIYSVTDKKFKRYGRVIELDTKEIVSVGKSLPMQQCGVSYTASEPQFEKLAVAETIKNEYFGGIDTQIGFCCGHNNALDALEWHTIQAVGGTGDRSVRDNLALLPHRGFAERIWKRCCACERDEYGA